MNRFLLVLSALVLCAIGSIVSAAPVTGAIWTTDLNGTVDRNIYDDKCDVWLNGGPRGGGGGLPDGTYYYQVTNPNGDVLLSTAPLASRTLVVLGGKVQPIVQLCPYLDTDNPGGEYKAWVTLVSDYDTVNNVFVPSLSKTDNFKVKLTPPPCDPNDPNCNPVPPTLGSIKGYKFYDGDLSHGFNPPIDTPLSCWVIQLWEVDVVTGIPELHTTLRTNSDGSYEFPLLSAGTYIVREVMPIDLNWIQTAPLDSATDLNPLDNVFVTSLGGAFTVVLTEVDEIVPTADGVNFGNVYVTPATGGFTLGYWSNKNGQAVLSGKDPAWRNLLNALCLVKANGSAFDVSLGSFSSSYTGFRTWLLNANAVNMAYMLSAQLTATVLDTNYKGLNSNTIVYLPISKAACFGSGSQFVKIGDVISTASALLCSDGYTPSGDPNRAAQGCVKDILDGINNNLFPFLSPTPGPIDYPVDLYPDRKSVV